MKEDYKIKHLEDLYNQALKDYDKAEEEIERLNKELDKTRLSELHKEYIINELEKWLKSEQERYRQYLSKIPTNDSEHTSHYATRCGLTQIEVVLEELQELKGVDK